jgi:hypothetical protein
MATPDGNPNGQTCLTGVSLSRFVLALPAVILMVDG